VTTIALLGATGRTGREVIAQAAKRGVKVKALAREPGKLDKLGVQVISGDIRNESALTHLFNRTDAVVSALGPTSMSTPVQAPAMEGIIRSMHAAQVKRYVAVSSAAAVVPGEKPEGFLAAMLWIAKHLLPVYVADKMAEVETMVGSDIDWTLIRVPGQLVDGSGRAVEVTEALQSGLPKAAQRQAIAGVLLDAVEERKWVRQAPWAAGARS
jgi:putative NADH-flavin reductase